MDLRLAQSGLANKGEDKIKLAKNLCEQTKVEVCGSLMCENTRLPTLV